MVVEEEYGGEEAYRCEECGFHYRKRKQAENCEEHCRDYGACDTEIAEKSLERKS